MVVDVTCAGLAVRVLDKAFEVEQG